MGPSCRRAWSYVKKKKQTQNNNANTNATKLITKRKNNNNNNNNNFIVLFCLVCCGSECAPHEVTSYICPHTMSFFPWLFWSRLLFFFFKQFLEVGDYMGVCALSAPIDIALPAITCRTHTHYPPFSFPPHTRDSFRPPFLSPLLFFLHFSPHNIPYPIHHVLSPPRTVPLPTSLPQPHPSLPVSLSLFTQEPRIATSPCALLLLTEETGLLQKKGTHHEGITWLFPPLLENPNFFFNTTVFPPPLFYIHHKKKKLNQKNPSHHKYE